MSNGARLGVTGLQANTILNKIRVLPNFKQNKCTFSPYIPAFFCPVHTRESLAAPNLEFDYLTSPAKQAACDLGGLHGSAVQRLLLENWSTIVLWKTWRCGGKGHVQIYVSICVYLCLHLYDYIWNDKYLHTFQLLAALLTIYTYGYTHNSIYVRTSAYLYTYVSTMHMPMYTYFHILTYHVPQSR